MKVNEQNNHREQSWKRQYVAPKVIVYGNLAEITKALHTGQGMNDSGKTALNKT